jgi:branched-chain amino acid transport system ATP-binding protein
MAEQPLLKVSGVGKEFGGLKALSDVNMEVFPGELRGVIGPNGAGKTTLFNVISGTFPPSSGRIYLKGEDISRLPPHHICKKGISRTFQLTSMFSEMTVLESIWAGVNATTRRPWNPFAPATNQKETIREAERICRLMRLEELANDPAANLPYGDQKILEIAMALSTNPLLLLLDEPTQGVGPEEAENIVKAVNSLRQIITIIMIEHTVEIVLRLCDRVTVLGNGQIISEGTSTEIANNQEVQRIYIGAL